MFNRICTVFIHENAKKKKKLKRNDQLKKKERKEYAPNFISNGVMLVDRQRLFGVEGKIVANLKLPPTIFSIRKICFV